MTDRCARFNCFSIAELANIGIRDNANLSTATYPDMPSPLKSPNWGETNARFKTETLNVGGTKKPQINIQPGKPNGQALGIFNKNLIFWEVLR